MIVTRFTCEILGAIPVGELDVQARLVRPGRSVEFLEAAATAGGREVARASAWRVLRTTSETVLPQADPPPALAGRTPSAAPPAGLDRRLPVRGRVAAGPRALRRAGAGHGLGPAALPPGPGRGDRPAGAGARRRRQRQRPVRRARHHPVAVHQPRAHRPPAPGGGGRVDLPGRADRHLRGRGGPGHLRPVGHSAGGWAWAPSRCWSAAGGQRRPQPGLLVHNRVPLPPAADQPGVPQRRQVLGHRARGQAVPPGQGVRRGGLRE